MNFTCNGFPRKELNAECHITNNVVSRLVVETALDLLHFQDFSPACSWKINPFIVLGVTLSTDLLTSIIFDYWWVILIEDWVILLFGKKIYMRTTCMLCYKPKYPLFLNSYNPLANFSKHAAMPHQHLCMSITNHKLHLFTYNSLPNFFKHATMSH